MTIVFNYDIILIRKEVVVIQIIYAGAKYTIFSQVEIPKKIFNEEEEKGYVYCCLILKENQPEIKIGTSCDIVRRMKQHSKFFKTSVILLWVSPPVTSYTALRVEKKQKDLWRKNSDWEYIRNDRFIIPDSVKELRIKIRKEYVFSVEVED